MTNHRISAAFGHRANAILLAMLLILSVKLSSQDLQFSAGRVRSVFAEGREQTVLEEGAEVENDEIFISATTISLSGEDNRYIESRGGVLLRDKQNDVELKAEYLSFDSRDEYLVLEGNAEFLDESEDILVRATFIERQNDLAVFQINVQILREDLIARAEYVRYFEDSGKLELSGFPIVYYRGDEYSADVISIFTESDEIILEGEVEGQISDDREDPAESEASEESASQDGGSPAVRAVPENSDAVPGTETAAPPAAGEGEDQ